IGALWRNAVAARRFQPAYLVESNGRWQPMSWRDAGRRVDEYANGLLALGIRKGDSFGILARTTVEWAFFDFALALVGAVTAPVYASSTAAECAHVLGHSDAVGVLVEDEAQFATIEETRRELPALEHVLKFDDLAAVAARGRAFAAENPRALADAEAAISEDDLYTYIYTSGTT